MLHHIQPPPARSRYVLGGVLAAAVACGVVLVLLSRGAAAGAATPAPPSYQALNSSQSTGLPIETIGSPAAKSLGTRGPVFPANLSGQAAANAPVGASIRKLSIDSPNTSAWIAKSPEGGICVLASRNHPVVDGAYGLGMSCAEAGATSATVELQSEGSQAGAIVGVVADDVSAVGVSLSDGESQTVATHDDAWTLEANAHLENKQEIVGG